MKSGISDSGLLAEKRLLQNRRSQQPQLHSTRSRKGTKMSHAPGQCAEVQSLVSVIIPAYNAEQFIAHTLDSVLAQTYAHYEVLVIDDGSQDGTANIVRRYAEKDDRIRLFQQPNSGVAAARNLGIELSNGEFIAPLDADDIWYPGNLEKQIRKFTFSESNIGLTYVWSVDIDKENNPTGVFRAAHIEGFVYATLLLHDFIANASSVMFRKSCISEVGVYKTNLEGREDWDFYLRIADHYEFRVVQEFLTGYRKLPDSMSQNYNSMAKSNEIIWQSIRQKHPNIPSFFYRLSTSSLYMHMAQQSISRRGSETALSWVKEALKKDWLTPMLRTGTYRIFLIFFFDHYIKSLESLYLPNRFSRSHNNAVHPGIEKAEKQASSKVMFSVNLPNQQNFKTICERVIHATISSVFNDSSTWLDVRVNSDGHGKQNLEV